MRIMGFLGDLECKWGHGQLLDGGRLRFVEREGSVFKFDVLDKEVEVACRRGTANFSIGVGGVGDAAGNVNNLVVENIRYKPMNVEPNAAQQIAGQPTVVAGVAVHPAGIAGTPAPIPAITEPTVRPFATVEKFGPDWHIAINGALEPITLSVPHVAHDPSGETRYLPAGTRLVVATPQQVEASAKVAEVSALIDAFKLGEARALLNEIAAVLGEGNIEVVGLRTMLHFMDTTDATSA